MKFKILFLLPLVTAGLTACNDDLEEKVFSNLTNETAFTSAENAQAAVDGMYLPLHQIYRDAMFNPNDGGTDVCLDRGDKAYEVLNDDAITTSARINVVWKNFYQVASRANIVIDQVGAMDDALFGDDYDKAGMIAEAHFMRAWAYYELTNTFYRVPLVLSSDVDVDAKLPVAEMSELEDAIEADLKAAAAGLPESYASTADAGRPTVGSAKGFLVRLYMRQAGRLRLNGGNADAKWNEALNAVNEVLAMEGRVYSLQPTVWDVFNPDTEATLYNNELMFTIRANENISSASWDLGLMFTDWAYDMGWNLFVVPLSFYWQFDPADQRRAQMMVTEYPDVYNPPIPNKSASYYVSPSVITQVGTLSKGNLDANGELKDGEDYGTIKELGAVFTRKYEYHNTFKYTYRTHNNMPVMRFADMILCKAEILNELNGPTQDAINLINRIRSRAFQDDDHGLKLADYSTKDALRNAICDERAFELYLECARRPDLIRMGLWKNRLEGYIAGVKAIANEREKNEGKPTGFYASEWQVYPENLTEDDIRRYMPVPKRESDYNPDLLNARTF